MDRMHGKRFLAWLIAAFAFSLLGASYSAASPRSVEVHEYERDFGVSQGIAERNLETQERGAGIVSELKGALGKHYAGVWFDNEAGEFVVPLLVGAHRATVVSVLSDDGLEDSYRITPATFTWEELEATQAQLDKSLSDHIRDRLVRTSLNPRNNAVLIHEAKAVNKAGEAALRRSAADVGISAEVKPESVEHFSSEPLACKTTAPRACGRPLRGGVSLTRDTGSFHQVGECSIGFKATGKVSGNRFVLTAGHCAAVFSKWGSEDANENFHPIGSVEEYSYPGGDWAKIKANGSEYWDWNPWPSQVAHYWEDQERSISYEAWSYLGQYVCHSGTQTGTSCGGVSALNVTSPYGVSHLTEVKNVCATGGDSGGPVFAGNTALGLLSGGDLIFPECERPILYVEITETTNAMGVGVGTRIGGAPTATTNPASSIQPTQATANGNVNPNSVETTYRFEYGTTTGYGSSLPVPNVSVGHGTGTVGVNRTLPNLKPGTTYHYRLVANSAAGTSYGGDVAFTTPLMPTPEAVLDQNGNEHVYTRSSNGQLSEWYQEGGVWKHKMWGYANMVAGTPSAVTTPGGNIWVYYRGTDNVLHRWWFNGPNWEEHQYGSAIVAGNPSAVTTGSGNIWVYYRGTDNVLHRWWFNGPNWEEHQYGSAIVTNDPSPVTTSDGSIWVYYRGTNGVLRRWWFKGQNWEEHQYGAAIVAGSPSAITTSDDSIWVYYRGTDWVLHRWWFNGPNWEEHQYGYAELGGDPSAVAGSAGNLDAFYVDQKWNLRHWWFKDQDWSLETIGSVN